MNTEAHGSGAAAVATMRNARTKRGGAGGCLLAGLLATLVLTGGCSLPEAKPDLTRYFVLTARPAAAAPAVGEAKPARVFLRAVMVPEFLRGKVMQVRLAENEVRFVDLARWAEPLEPGLGRVVRENLASQAVTVVGRGGDAHDYDLVVHLRSCEGVLPAGVARLAARIEVISAALDQKPVAQDEVVIEVPGWDGQDYGQLAGKLSEAAAGLSERIVRLLPPPQA